MQQVRKVLYETKGRKKKEKKKKNKALDCLKLEYY